MSKYCEKCGCYLPVGGEKCSACGYSKKTEIKHDKFLEATYKEINRMKNTNVFNNTSNSFVWKPEDYVNVANKPEVIKARIESQIMDVNENLKEKLVDLLEPHMSGLACEYESGSCELTSCRSCNARNIADHLISNGVTVRELDGCKYCKKYEDLPEHFIDGKPVGRVSDTCIQTDENGLWHIEVPYGADIGIQFCPMCGRKLPRPQERE